MLVDGKTYENLQGAQETGMTEHAPRGTPFDAQGAPFMCTLVQYISNHKHLAVPYTK